VRNKETHLLLRNNFTHFFEKMSTKTTEARYIDYCLSRVSLTTSEFDCRRTSDPHMIITELIKLSSPRHMDKESYTCLLMKTLYDFEHNNNIIVNSANVSLITAYALLMLVKQLEDEHYLNINRLWAETLNINLKYFNRLEILFLIKAEFTMPTLEEAIQFKEDWQFLEYLSKRLDTQPNKKIKIS